MVKSNSQPPLQISSNPNTLSALKNIESLPTRTGLYYYNAFTAPIKEKVDEAKLQKPKTQNDKVQKNQQEIIKDGFEGVVSAIDTLANPVFKRFLSETQLDEFAASLNQEKDNRLKLISDPKEASKFKNIIARITADLKGFEVPAVDDNDRFGISEDEAMKVVAATKETMINLSSENISSGNYSNKLIQETIKVLGKSEQNETKLASYTKYLESGKKIIKKNTSDMIEDDIKIVNEAAFTSSKKLVNLFQATEINDIHSAINTTMVSNLVNATKLSNKEKEELSVKITSLKGLWEFKPENLNIDKIKYLENPTDLGSVSTVDQAFKQIERGLIVSSSFEQKLTIKPEKLAEIEPKILAEAIVKKAIESVKATSKSNMTPEVEEKIKKNLTDNLSKLDSKHLVEHMADLASNISEKLLGNRSLLSRIINKFEISSSSLDKIALNIVEEEVLKGAKVSTKEADNLNKSEGLSRKSVSFKEDVKVIGNESEKLELSEPKPTNKTLLPLKLSSQSMNRIKSSPVMIDAYEKLHNPKVSTIHKAEPLTTPPPRPQKPLPEIPAKSSKPLPTPPPRPSQPSPPRPLPTPPIKGMAGKKGHENGRS